MDSLVLQTALGLVFVFAVFAALASVLTEFVTRFGGLRGEYLLRGIRTLVDGGGHFQLGMRDLVRREATEPAAAPATSSQPGPGAGEPAKPFTEPAPDDTAGARPATPPTGRPVAAVH